MPGDFGPMEIDCDAPPYSVVRAGTRIGLLSPEDVRWCRMSHFLQREDRPAGLGAHTWKWFPGAVGGLGSCNCGQQLPRLEMYTFMFRTGNEASYFLGQCTRCQTIYWDEA